MTPDRNKSALAESESASLRSRVDGSQSEATAWRRAETQDEVAAVEARTGVGGARIANGATGAWQDIKSRFVDDPARAIADAEALVQQTLDRRIQVLEDEAAALRETERDGDATSTETLRTKLIRYQAYCERVGTEGAGIH